MKDEDKTKEQLIKELAEMRQRIAELKRLEIDHKRAEEALRESEAKNQAFLEAIPDLMFRLSKDGTFLDFVSVEDMGPFVSPSEFLGKKIYEVFPAEETQQAMHYLERALQTGETQIFEYQLPLVGEIHDYEARYVASGEDEVLAIVRDITRRKRAEKALRESEAQKKAILDGITTNLAFVNENLEIIWVNKASADSVNKSPEDMIGHKCHEFWADPKKPCEGCPTVKAFRTKKTEHIIMVTPDGRVWDEKGEPVFDAEGRLIGVTEIAHDITERKRAEEEIKTKTQFLENLILQSPFSTFVMDSKGVVVMVNDAFLRLFSVPQKEMILGKNALTEPSNIQQGTIKYFNKALSGKTVETPEIEFISPFDNKRTVTKGRLFPVFDANNKLTNVVVMHEDITKRKRAVEDLRESEERYRMLIEQSVEAIYMFDPETKHVLEANPAFLNFLGYTDEEVHLLTIYDFIMHDRESIDAYVQQILASGATTVGERVWQRKDGTTIDVRVTASKIQQGGKDIIFVVTRDITELKQTEEALRKSEERYQDLYDYTPDMYFSVKPDGRVISVNKFGAEYLGYSKEELIGGFVWVVVHKDDLEMVQKQVSEIFSRKLPKRDLEFRKVRKDGSTLWVRERTQLILDEDGTPKELHIICRDITERKQTEVALRERTEALERSNEELELFAYVASHDLQEPLRMVSSYVQLLECRYKGKLDPDADDFIAFAVDGANRMQTLINDLLAFSRVSRRGKPFEPIDCEVVLDVALANLQMKIDECVAVISHDHLPTVMADGSQLVQLFQNLINNAITFRGKEPPRIHVSARRQEDKSSIYNELTTEQKGDEWLFSVRDSGIGIDPDYAERIFVIFQRLHTRREYPGTGIGLAICKRIVERHGGRIWVKSQPGKGSTFYFTIVRKE